MKCKKEKYKKKTYKHMEEESGIGVSGNQTKGDLNLTSNQTSVSNNKFISDTEYSSIRNEIISDNTIKNNYYIAMYTIVIAIFCIAFESDMKEPWLYYLPYVALIPMQRATEARKIHALKLSAFLAVFANDKWEKEYANLEKKFELSYSKNRDEFYREKYSNIGCVPKKGIIYYIKSSKLIKETAFHLSLCCSITGIIHTYNAYGLSMEFNLFLTLGIFLFFILIVLDIKSEKSMKIREKYILCLKLDDDRD